MSETVSPSLSRANVLTSWIALVLALMYFSYRGPIIASGGRLWDYAVYASSSYEWAQGRDPYDQAAVNISWKIRHPGYGIEPSLARWQAIAPPWTLAALAPFATLPIVVGSYLYLGVALLLNAFAAWRCATWAGIRRGEMLRWFAAALLISVPMKLGLASGNPVVLAAPLLLLGLHESWRGRAIVGGVLLGLGTAYKMQLGLPMLAFWLVCGCWRPTLAAFGLFAVIAAIGILRPQLAGVDAWHGWLTNVAASNGPGGVNDFTKTSNPDDHLNLQVPLWWLTGDRTLVNGGAIALWLLPATAFAAWLFLRRGKLDDATTTLAAIGLASLLCVLPIYHRAYDGLLFVPIVAVAVSLLAPGSRERMFGVVILVLLAPMVIPSGLPGLLERRGYIPSWMTNAMLFRAVVVPIKVWSAFATCCALLVYLLRGRASTRGTR